MKKLINSMSYKTNWSIIDQALEERDFRDLWLFEYTCRHVEGGLGIEVNEEEKYDLLIGVCDIASHHVSFSDDEFERFQQLLTFSYELVYALHKQTYSDGFLDPVGESQLQESSLILEDLTLEERDIVRRLHELTCHSGFLITDLWQGPTEIWDYLLLFIKSYPKDPKDLKLIPRFFLPKRTKHNRGIQISVPPFETAIQSNWDMVLYFSDSERVSHVKASIDSCWDEEGPQAIGDAGNYQIALYVNRSSCTKRHVILTLKLQIDRLRLYGASSPAGSVRDPIGSLADQIREEEDIKLKRWSVTKNNVRRAVGLYIWDQVKFPSSSPRSRKAIIEDCIELIRKENHKALELYFRDYNKSTKTNGRLGDLEKHHLTVIREMEADCDLAALCIDKADYLSPHDVKRKKEPER